MSKKTKKRAEKGIELNITLPKGWDELSGEQVLIVAKHITAHPDEPLRMLIELAIEIAGLIPNGSKVGDDGEILHTYYTPGLGNIHLSSEQISFITDHMMWVVETTTLMESPPIRNLIRPNKCLYGISFEQYMTADLAHRELIRRAEALDVTLNRRSSHVLELLEPMYMMCASLYPRNAFNAANIESEAQMLNALTYAEIYSMLLWFISAKSWLRAKYPYVFDGDGSSSETTPIPGDEEFMGLLLCLNEGRVVDNEKIKATDIHEVLFQLNEKIKSARKNV